MTKPDLFLTRFLPEPVMAAIAERFRLTRTPGTMAPDRPTLLAGIGDAQAMICTLSEQIDSDLLQAAPRLRIVANCAVGYNNIDLDAARARGVVVTNTPDVLTETTADLTWALLLAVARRVPEGHRLVQDGHWTGWELTQLLGTDIHGKTLGIIGMGRIGKAVARRAIGFNMPVLYHTRSPILKGRQDSWAHSWRQVLFHEVLARADFLTLHVPLAPETHHLIGAAEIRAMRSTAFLINTCRGSVVNEAALVEAITENRIAGAALDVYEREPAIHPGLRTLTQVVTLPHVGSATLTTRVQMGMMCLENVTEVLAGRPAPNRVS